MGERRGDQKCQNMHDVIYEQHPEWKQTTQKIGCSFGCIENTPRSIWSNLVVVSRLNVNFFSIKKIIFFTSRLRNRFFLPPAHLTFIDRDIYRIIIHLVTCNSFHSITGRPRYMRSFYLRFRIYATENWLFFATDPLINSHPWSLYLLICYLRAYFFRPYLSHIMRETWTWFVATIITYR